MERLTKEVQVSVQKTGALIGLGVRRGLIGLWAAFSNPIYKLLEVDDATKASSTSDNEDALRRYTEILEKITKKRG